MGTTKTVSGKWTFDWRDSKGLPHSRFQLELGVRRLHVKRFIDHSVSDVASGTGNGTGTQST